MGIMRKLEVTLTNDRFSRPLVVIDSSLGNGAELYPEQLRALAGALCKAADDSEARPVGKSHLYAKKAVYDLCLEK